ncbi:MAG TPA: glycosyltransferase family 4 protein [Actinomycetota bacterium]|nr:glycosyltransferase family 4 protein [Actinomycetota bacterium]
MRIAVCHAQTPFARGGAEMHTESLALALREAGHEVEIVGVPFKWYPPSEIVHQMGIWRSLDLTEANGMPIDLVIALKFPAYLVRHERKIVWLIHQHRTAYELWDHPVFGDLSPHEGGAEVRDMIWRADRLALGEAKRIFSNSAHVADRLRTSLGMTADPLYHRSSVSEMLLEAEPDGYGDYLLFPSRLEPIKRQRLAIDAWRHVRSDVRLVLVGGGFDEPALRARIEEAGLQDRVILEGAVPLERLLELYRGALGVYYGPFDEDFGYVTLEGMAARRPVITLTDSGGPLELVEEGVTGLIAPPQPEAIAESVETLAARRGLAPEMGAAGRASFESRVPPWPQVVDRLLS